MSEGMRRMRWALIIVGILLVLIGGVWILQGSSILPGSFMSGDVFWARIGSLMLVAGAILCGLGIWLRARGHSL